MLKAVVLAGIILLSGCSMLDVVKGAAGLGGSGPSLSVDAQVGDKEQTVEVRSGHDQQADTITNIQEVDPLLLIVAIIGWILPAPHKLRFTNPFKRKG